MGTIFSEGRKPTALRANGKWGFIFPSKIKLGKKYSVASDRPLSSNGLTPADGGEIEVTAVHVLY